MSTVVDLNDLESQVPLNPNDDSTTKNDLGGELDGELSKGTPAGFSFKNLSLKQLYALLWTNMRSWGSFIDTSKFKLPTATMQWSKRFFNNVEYFQSNYICVFAILLIYCVLTSPFLLLVLSASAGACYLVTLKHKESPIKILSYELSLTHLYAGIAICAFPFFWLVGAGSAVFWVLGASLFVICGHASLYAVETIVESEENKQDLFPPFPAVSFVTPATQTV